MSPIVSAALLGAEELCLLSSRLAHMPHVAGQIGWRPHRHGTQTKVTVWNYVAEDIQIWGLKPAHWSQSGRAAYRQDVQWVGAIHWAFEGAGWARAFKVGGDSFALLYHFPRHAFTPRMIEEMAGRGIAISSAEALAQAIRRVLHERNWLVGAAEMEQQLSAQGLRNWLFQGGEMFGNLPAELAQRSWEAWQNDYHAATHLMAA